MAEGLILNRFYQTSETPSTEGDYVVRFIDYDGTILKTEYVDSGNNATAPSNPDRTAEGLTFIEWNNAYTNVTRDIDVGATYETTDGKTHVFVTVTAVTGLSLRPYINKSDTSELTISWGDGTTDYTTTTNGLIHVPTHTYASVGDYEITMWISSGTGTFTFGNGSNTTAFLDDGQEYCLTKLFIGDDTVEIGDYVFYYCYSLANIVIPSGVTSIGNSVFYNCSSLANIVIPSGVTSIGNSVFYNCSSLANIVIPSSVTSIGSSAFRYCYSLTNITIPSGVTSIGDYYFQTCYSLTNIVIPSSVTSIGSSAFSNCFSIIEYDFTNHESIPSLGNTSAFVNINRICKIKVPSALEASWKVATNWSAYANYIIGV